MPVTSRSPNHISTLKFESWNIPRLVYMVALTRDKFLGTRLMCVRLEQLLIPEVLKWPQHSPTVAALLTGEAAARVRSFPTYATRQLRRDRFRSLIKIWGSPQTHHRVQRLLPPMARCQ